jgi:hypothetical protein
MTRDAATFRALLPDLFTRFGSKPRGTSATELAKIERELGMGLPAILRECHLLAGEHRLSRFHDRLLPPREMRLERGALIFVEQHQGVAHYAIGIAELGQEDPPVLQGQPGDEAWYDECGCLSTFMLNWYCWQFVNSTNEATAVLDEQLLAALESRLVRAAPGQQRDHFDPISFAESGLVVVAFPHQGRLHVAAKRKRALTDFERDFGCSLDRLF